MKHDRKKSKNESQAKHAIGRLKERYDVEVTREQYARLCNYIKKGKTYYEDGTKVFYLARQSLRVTLWKIEWNGLVLYAVYDKIHKTIATFLPHEWAQRNNFEEIKDEEYLLRL